MVVMMCRSLLCRLYLTAPFDDSDGSKINQTFTAKCIIIMISLIEIVTNVLENYASGTTVMCVFICLFGKLNDDWALCQSLHRLHIMSR